MQNSTSAKIPKRRNRKPKRTRFAHTIMGVCNQNTKVIIPTVAGNSQNHAKFESLNWFSECLVFVDVVFNKVYSYNIVYILHI